MIFTIGSKCDESDVKGKIEDRVEAKEEIKKTILLLALQAHIYLLMTVY